MPCERGEKMAGVRVAFEGASAHALGCPPRPGLRLESAAKSCEWMLVECAVVDELLVPSWQLLALHGAPTLAEHVVILPLQLARRSRMSADSKREPMNGMHWASAAGMVTAGLVWA